MKYLLLLLLLAYLFNRFAKRRAHKIGMPPAPPADPQTIVACAQCGLHLPQDEALPGRGGMFCSIAHRNAFEAAHG